MTMTIKNTSNKCNLMKMCCYNNYKTSEIQQNK